jgi:hypothetical protein
MNKTVRRPPENHDDVLIPCSVCREPIRRGARKCIHCNSMLDWRGWLGISETALALLVALVTVVGASAPRVVALLTHKYSDVRLSYYQVNGQFLQLTAWNQGNSNGLLLSAKIVASAADGKQVETINLENATPSPVLAGQVSSAGFRVPPSQIPDFLGWPHHDIRSVSLIAKVVDFGKQAEDRTVAIPVTEFRQFCRATEDSDIQARHPNQVDEKRTATKC